MYTIDMMERVLFFASRRRHTICALVTGVQTCALPILLGGDPVAAIPAFAQAERAGARALAIASDRGLAYDLVGDNVTEFGIASGREGVCQYVLDAVVPVSLKHNNDTNRETAYT